MAKTPEFPKPILMEEGKAHATIEWQGLQIKNLDTLGERSATGMDTERGVYVISVNALGSVLRDYIRPNDVILELGGKTVNNLADLQKAGWNRASPPPARGARLGWSAAQCRPYPQCLYPS